MNKINIWAVEHNKTHHYTHYRCLYQLVDRWIKKYPDISFDRKTYFKLKVVPANDEQRNEIFSLYEKESRKLIFDTIHPFYFIIENENTKKYFLISYWDRAADTQWVFQNRYDAENLVEMFTAQGCQLGTYYLQEDTSIKYTPINKILWVSDAEKEIEKLMQDENENSKNRFIPTKLFFASGKYQFREYLIDNDFRFDAFCAEDCRLSDIEHINKLNKYWINMEIYSTSGVSMRLIEGFGLGTAVLSPKFPQRHHTEIIPDYHFVDIKYNDINIDFKILADAYIESFEQLKKDKEKIRFIAANARNYYLENCTSEKYTDTLEMLIDINKLF